MYIFIVIVILSIFVCILLNKKEGFDNLLKELPINISEDNKTISVPNTINGNKGNDITFSGSLGIANNTIHKGNTFIKPTSYWTNSQPLIDMAIGDDDTGLKWKEEGIVSFWGDSQEIGTFGKDGITMKNQRTLEFGKGDEKEGNAGKIGYRTFTGNSLDIVGAGRNGETRKVQISDDLNVGNNLSVNTNTTLKQTTLNGKTRIIGNNLLEFGADTGKVNTDNGTISYKTSWDPNALNIVGAENGGPRKVHMWDDVVIDGNLRINGGLTIGQVNQRWTIASQDHGRLNFLRNDTGQNDYNDNVGHLMMSPDGNLHLTKNPYRGWISDNLSAVNGKRDAFLDKRRREMEAAAVETKRLADIAAAAAEAETKRLADIAAANAAAEKRKADDAAAAEKRKADDAWAWANRKKWW